MRIIKVLQTVSSRFWFLLGFLPMLFLIPFQFPDDLYELICRYLDRN